MTAGAYSGLRSTNADAPRGNFISNCFSNAPNRVTNSCRARIDATVNELKDERESVRQLLYAPDCRGIGAGEEDDPHSSPS